MMTTLEMISVLALVPLAYAVDLLIGDPQNITHPVIYIGHMITKLEQLLYNTRFPGSIMKLRGAVVVAFTVGVAYILTWIVLALLEQIHPLLSWLVAIWLISTTIAQTGLARAALPIAQALDRQDLKQARQLTGQIVGRDTEQLDGHELVRATVETVAENTIDGVTAPLFYAFIGGAPLAMAYRAVNTLDSMLGYKNERYANFGWAAARFDDLINVLPARLTALVLPLAVRLCGLNVSGAIGIMRRDAKKHPSPNSGFMEAGFAGAMDITLGGENFYQGKASLRARMGNVRRPLHSGHIRTAVRLMQVVSVLLFVVLFSILVVWRWV